MMKRILVLVMVAAILCSAAMLPGCSKPSDTDPKVTVSPEPTPTVSAEPTEEPNDSPLANLDLGPLPEVPEPQAGDEGAVTEDGEWYINNLSEFKDDRLIVNASGEHGIAFYVKQGLGDAWKASAIFRPIKRYPDDQPICSRLFVNDIHGSEVFILTVNYINNSVEVQLQMLDKIWKTLITTDGWVETSSTAFYFSLEREADSKRLSIHVEGDKGVLISKATPVDIPDELLERATVAGFGTYSSATEYSGIEVIGNGPENVEYPVPSEEE